MKSLPYIPTPLLVFVCTLLLGYGVAINVENMRGTQRYELSVNSEDGKGLAYFRCLTMEEGVTREMEYEKEKARVVVELEKMNVLTKWAKC